MNGHFSNTIFPMNFEGAKGLLPPNNVVYSTFEECYNTRVKGNEKELFETDQEAIAASKHFTEKNSIE